MRFSETVKHVADDLVVSRRHEAWLKDNDHPTYSMRAMEFAYSTTGQGGPGQEAHAERVQSG